MTNFLPPSLPAYLSVRSSHRDRSKCERGRSTLYWEFASHGILQSLSIDLLLRFVVDPPVFVIQMMQLTILWNFSTFREFLIHRNKHRLWLISFRLTNYWPVEELFGNELMDRCLRRKLFNSFLEHLADLLSGRKRKLLLTNFSECEEDERIHWLMGQWIMIWPRDLWASFSDDDDHKERSRYETTC